MQLPSHFRQCELLLAAEPLVLIDPGRRSERRLGGLRVGSDIGVFRRVILEFGKI